jgi:hypothetical protein
MPDNRLSRRAVLRLTAAGAVAGAGATTLTTLPAYADEIDYTARQTFDDWDRLFQQGGPGQPDQPNDNTNRDGRSGMLAWSQSYVLLGLVRMYEKYRDTHYLDRLIDNIDQVLAVRDSERGVKDYRGLSLPAWRADHPYTTGYATLADGNGQPLLDLREALSYAEDTTVTVTAGTRPDTFTVQLVNTFVNRTVTHTDLSLDPASPDYAVSRIYAAAPGPLQLTAADRRAVPRAADVPQLGAYTMHCEPVIFAVHTGMITYPIASFVRIVLSSPALRRRYQRKALEYLVACREAVAVHDWEYRDGGYLVWPKAQPLAYDGCEQPLNQSVGLGQTLVELALATRDREYRRKVAAMGRMLAAQFTVDAGDAYLWHYWPTGGHIYDGFVKTGDPDTDVSVFTPVRRTGPPVRGHQPRGDRCRVRRTGVSCAARVHGAGPGADRADVHPERRGDRRRRAAGHPHHGRRHRVRRAVGRGAGATVDPGERVRPAGPCAVPRPLQPLPADSGTRRPAGHRLRLAPCQCRLPQLGPVTLW